MDLVPDAAEQRAVADDGQAQPVPLVRQQFAQPDERVDQAAVVLHILDPAHRADDELGAARMRLRQEAFGVDAVGDHQGLGVRHADDLPQPALQVFRHRDIAVDEGRDAAPQQVVLAVQAMRVAGVAAVLRMHADRHAGHRGRERIFDGGQVIAVQDRGLQAAQQLPQLQVRAQPQPRRLVQRDDLDIVAADLAGELGVAGQADDRVPVLLRRHAVDAFGHQRFQAAEVEAVDQVDDERCGLQGRGSFNACHSPPARFPSPAARSRGSCAMRCARSRGSRRSAHTPSGRRRRRRASAGVPWPAAPCRGNRWQ